MHKGLIIEILINCISKPLQIGFYKDKNLVEVKEYDGLTSDILLPILKNILENNSVSRFIYTNGPGSHMATKITYITLKTISILKDIEIKSVSAFELNGNKPIKALGKLYFIKEKETIITKKFQESVDSSFFMPKSLNEIKIVDTIEPQYNIAAV